MHTYTDSKNIYSVDLMIAYVNIYKPQTIKINPNDYINSIIMYPSEPKNNLLKSIPA